MRRALRAVRLALAFLTIVPVPLADAEVTPEALGDSRWAYPVVGLGLGLGLAGLSELFRALGLADAPSAFVLVAVLAALTGGLHLDGLADTADGLFLWGDADRRLAVMRDPRVGSFGVVALVLVLLGGYVALSTLNGPARSWAILGAIPSARLAILVAAGLAPYARPEGTGRILVEATTRTDALMASLLILAIGAVSAGWRGLVGGALVVAVAAGLSRMARAKLGGVTGDILGATVELGQLGFLMSLAGLMGRPG